MDPSVEPLDDTKVEIIQRKLGNLDKKGIAELNDIYDTFHKLIKQLVTFALRQLQPDDTTEIAALEQIKRVLRLVPTDELFIRSKDKIWATREQIIKRDIQWFISQRVDHLIKKDKKQVMIETLVSIVKNTFSERPVEEQIAYWNHIDKLLHEVARYEALLDKNHIR